MECNKPAQPTAVGHVGPPYIALDPDHQITALHLARQIAHQREVVLDCQIVVDDDRAVETLRTDVRELDRAEAHLAHLMAWENEVAGIAETRGPQSPQHSGDVLWGGEVS